MKSIFKLRNIALLAGAALLSTGALAVSLTEQTVTRTETIKYSVSDATTVEGATALYQKLQSAATRVCGEAGEAAFGGFRTASSLEACVAGSLGKAVQDVGNPLVLAVHLQAGGRKLAD
jgi:UrcA family protein